MNEKSNKDAFVCNGCSNHSSRDREQHDYYATPPEAVKMLCDLEHFSDNILEPACGSGHISKVLQERGYNVKSQDLIDRGFGEVADFLSPDSIQSFDGDVVTNPPYALAKEFVEKSLSIIPEGNKVAMFLKLTFLEGKARGKMYKYTPPIQFMSPDLVLIAA